MNAALNDDGSVTFVLPRMPFVATKLVMYKSIEPLRKAAIDVNKCLRLFSSDVNKNFRSQRYDDYVEARLDVRQQ